MPVTSLLSHSPHIIKVDVMAKAAIEVTKVEWLLVRSVYDQQRDSLQSVR